MKKETNPFANKDGSPIDGKHAEFFQWQIEYAKKKNQELSPEERKQKLDAERRLNDQMNSESIFPQVR